MSLKECRKLLVAAAGTIKAVTRGDIRRKAKQANHFCNKPDDLDDNTVEAEVDQWFDELAMNEGAILRVYPGKELLNTVRVQISSGHRRDHAPGAEIRLDGVDKRWIRTEDGGWEEESLAKEKKPWWKLW